MSTIGWIGLGNLGAPLAARLAGGPATLRAHDRDAARMAAIAAQGAQTAASAADAVRGADIVITCLPSPAATAAVLEAILPAMAPGTTWIEMSTLGRDEVLAFAARAAAAGVEMLEAPVTGGVHLAARGEITVLAGGPEALVARHRALLGRLGGRVFHIGPLGSAAVIKVITNMLAFIHLVADGEALMLAARGGLDLRTAWEAIRASSGNSFVHETEGQLILSGSYDIAFTMELALKDLGFAAGFGHEFGVPLELATQTREIFLRAAAAYGRAAQSTEVVRLIEEACATPLRAPGFPARLE